MFLVARVVSCESQTTTTKWQPLVRVVQVAKVAFCLVEVASKPRRSRAEVASNTNTNAKTESRIRLHLAAENVVVVTLWKYDGLHLGKRYAIDPPNPAPHGHAFAAAKCCPICSMKHEIWMMRVTELRSRGAGCPAADSIKNASKMNFGSRP